VQIKIKVEFTNKIMVTDNTKYNIKSNNFSFKIQKSELKNVDFIYKTSTEINLIDNNKTYNCKVIESNFLEKKCKIEINGDIFELEIEDELDQLVDKMGFGIAKTKKLINIKAPMPGLVLEIAVENGQEVLQGDKILVLEAMKMENVIKIAANSKIKEILVVKGQAVEKGQILIELFA
jgi:biotin carboxyl carrier protein